MEAQSVDALFSITRPAFSSFMSDCIQLKKCPDLWTNCSIALLFCCQGCMCLLFIYTAESAIVDGVGLFATLCKPLLEGDSLRDTYEHCETLQLLPTVPRAAALTYTHTSICHQREPWEAGAASSACHHRTLLTAGAIFCKRQKYEQHDYNHPTQLRLQDSHSLIMP